MKVLFLNNFYYLRGGSERVLFEEMRMLREAGHDVAVFTRSYKLNQSAPHDRFFPGEIQRDRYSISLDGVRTVREMVYSASARRGLRRLLEEFKPDVAHAHNIYGGLSTAVLDAVKETGKPTVMTLHDFKLLCPSYLMLNRGRVCERCGGSRFYHAVLARCHKNSYLASGIYAAESYFSGFFNKYAAVNLFIAPSRFLLNKHQEFGWNPDRFVHIPNPARLNGTETAPGAGGHVLFFGRLSREKGVRTLIEAFTKTQTEVQLAIAGDGADRAALEAMAARQGKGRIRFLGFLTAEPLGRAIDSARAVVVPSEWYENAPMAILEAFSHGKPVIGARIGGVPEMIDDGVNGFLFEPGDAEDLRNKLESFLALPEGRVREMGRAARSTVQTEYSAASHYNRLMQAYSTAMGRA